MKKLDDDEDGEEGGEDIKDFAFHGCKLKKATVKGF
jgi:hypothetical protein